MYKPVDTVYNAQKLAELNNVFDTNKKSFITSLTALQLSKKNTVKNLSKERSKLFNEMINQKSFFLDNSSEEYIQNIFEDILKKNNITLKNQKIILSRETSPNAVSLGNGLFFVNISLFCRMNSKDEIKFILSHELAHQILQHLEKSLKTDDAIINSETFKTNVKVAKKSETSSGEKMLDLLREYQYNNRKDSRLHEQEADELGFSLFKTVAENPTNALVALKKLDSISPIEITQLDQKDYQTFFSTPDLKFKEEWNEIFGAGNYTYSNKTVNALGFDENLLKSHPDLAERISLLKSKNNIIEDKNFSNADAEFLIFKQKMINETLYSFYILKEYGKGLYFALQLVKTDPANLFAMQMRGKFLKKLAKARKNYTYKKVVEDVDIKHQSASYYHFLAILENLSTSELEDLSNFYLKN